MDLHDGHELWTTNASTNIIIALAFSPDGKTLASAGGFGEKDIRLWDVPTGREIGRLEGHTSFVSSLVFCPDGKKLASGSGDQTIRVWDVPSQTCLDTLRGHRLEVYRVALLPDGKTLVSGCKDGTVCVWDTSETHPRQDYITLPDTVTFCFEPDSQSILTVGKSGVTRRSGPKFEQSEPLPEIDADWSSNPVFSGDGHYLAGGSTDGVQIWDLQRRTLRCQLTNVTDSMPLEFFGNGKGLVTLSRSGSTLVEWDLVTQRERHSWNAPVHLLPTLTRRTLATSPDSQQLIAIGIEGDILCANLNDGSEHKPGLNILEASCIDYSPDGKFLAVSSHLGLARVWDTATWGERATLSGYLVGLTSLAYSPDGDRLATGSDGKEAIRIWDTESWRDVLTLEGQGANFHTLAFSSDGNTVGALNITGTLYLWRAPSWEEIKAEEARDKMKGKQL